MKDRRNIESGIKTFSLKILFGLEWRNCRIVKIGVENHSETSLSRATISKTRTDTTY